MSYLLDSTVIIDYRTGRRGGIRIVEQLFARSGDLYICEVVTCESDVRRHA